MAWSLTGRIAFVTGSERGLGLVIAEWLAELGADVAIHDLDAAQPAKIGEFRDLDNVAARIGRHGMRVVAVTGNIGDPAAVAAMKAAIDAALGGGRYSGELRWRRYRRTGRQACPKDPLTIAFEDIRVLTENNLIGTMLVCQAFVPPMVAAGFGSVINIASAAAHLGVSPEVVYSALKAAVVHYTCCLAKELIPTGVRVNAVSPGPTNTARFEATRVVDPVKMNSTSASLDRSSEPEEIADALAFLAGPRSRFINGQVLRVDGGLTLFAG